MAASKLTRLKLAVGSVAAAAVLGFIPGSASAQIIQFLGWTNGCFTVTGCNVNSFTTNAYQSSTLTSGSGAGLRYNNSLLNALVPSGSTVQLNNGPAAPGTQNLNNFGSFDVIGPGCCAGPTIVNTPFQLLVTLISPLSTQVLFSGLLSGQISVGPTNIQSGAWFTSVTFTSLPQNVTWVSNGGGSGTLTINNLSVNGGRDHFSVSGAITAQVTPEPMSMMLVGTGLLGVFGAAWRRRRSASLTA